MHCRLDFFLTTNSLSSAITKADILPGYKTDHSLITLYLANNTNPRGPGFWKLNTYFLSDSEYTNLIKTTITEIANEYQNNTEEKRHFNTKTIKQLQLENSSVIKTDEEILTEAKSFYQNLYASRAPSVSEKAFDGIEWYFIEKTLRHFNFGTSLVSWVKLSYTNISSCVLNNGLASDFFSLHRGVRQGCPLSPYLFILGPEILGNAVRRDTEIRGIRLGNSDCKLSQYADDTTMILDGSERSFSRTLYVLD